MIGTKGREVWRKVFAITSSVMLYILVFGAWVENLSRWIPIYMAILLSVLAPFGWVMYAYRGMTIEAALEQEQ